MDVVERTAMRVVVEQRAPGLALVVLGVAALAAVVGGLQLMLTGQWPYLVVVAGSSALAVFGLWLFQGVRTTLDASTGLARWERLGILPARREASLAEVRGLVFLPASEDGVPTYDPVLTVGDKRWPLSTRSTTDVEAVRKAVTEVLDLAKGRRAY